MIEKILREINRLKKELNGYSASEALDYIEAYINTLPKEPGCEDLEEAAINAWNKYSGLELMHIEEVVAFFREAAEWQKNKDLEDCLKSDMTMPNKFYEKGRYDMQQEMMKDAISCNVDWYDGFRLDYTQEQQDDILLKLGADVGDKVKIIIVKEK